MKKLSKDEMKKVMGGVMDECPPNTYMCFCKRGSDIGPDLDAYGQNIIEAAANAEEYCSGMGWPDVICSENWGC